MNHNRVGWSCQHWREVFPTRNHPLLQNTPLAHPHPLCSADLIQRKVSVENEPAPFLTDALQERNTAPAKCSRRTCFVSGRAPGHRGGVQTADSAPSQRNYGQHDLSKEGAQKRDTGPPKWFKIKYGHKKERTEPRKTVSGRGKKPLN